MAKSKRVITKIPSPSRQGLDLSALEVTDVAKLYELGLVPGLGADATMTGVEGHEYDGYRKIMDHMSTRFFLPRTDNGIITSCAFVMSSTSFSLKEFVTLCDLYCARLHCVIPFGTKLFWFDSVCSNSPFILVDANMSTISSGYKYKVDEIDVLMRRTFPTIGEVTVGHMWQIAKLMLEKCR